MIKTVYLAGGISGLSKEAANKWRQDFIKSLPKGIVGISPLRCEPDVGDKTYSATYDDIKWGTSSAISSKNYYDVINCDATIAFFPKTSNEIRPSYGTTFEVAWASMARKPIIIVTDDEVIKSHALFQHVAGWIVPDLDHAREIVIGLFSEYVNNGSELHKLSRTEFLKKKQEVTNILENQIYRVLKKMDKNVKGISWFSSSAQKNSS